MCIACRLSWSALSLQPSRSVPSRSVSRYRPGGCAWTDAGPLLRGSLLFLIGLLAMALSPWYSLAFVLLLIGGLGTAAFSNMQTTLILTEAPPATRSRIMDIVTMYIGTGPVGVVMIGILSGQVGSPVAILIMAALGICGLSIVWRKLIKGPAGG
jgi:MFS family permease